MKITFKILTSKTGEYYASEEELKNNITNYCPYLAIPKNGHYASLTLKNNLNETFTFKDDMQHIMFAMCLRLQQLILEDKMYTYTKFGAFIQYDFFPVDDKVVIQHDKNKSIAFDKNKLCIELYKCGQRYIDFLFSIPNSDYRIDAESFQSFADQTKALLQEKGLL